MLKVYSPKNEALGFLNDVFDLQITKEIGGMEEMHFYVPVDSPESKMLQLEGYVALEGEQRFVVRELNVHGKDIEVFCVIAVENLYGSCWSTLSRKGITLVDAFEYAVQYTGWKVVNKSSAVTRTRDIYIQNQTVWEILKVLCEVYFVEMSVDTWTRTITLHDKVGTDSGAYFISDTNLLNFRKDTSTHKLITRLIPLGKDGMTISSVNGGKNYIDNNKYSSKLLYGLWVQTAYTNPQQLKDDATQWLEEYAKPFVTYNVDIIDLYRLDDNQNFKFELGDTVTIIDKLTEEKAVQRVVKMVIYPHDPSKNSIELSNKNKSFQDYFRMIQLMNNLASHFIQTNGSSTGTGDVNTDKTPPKGSVGSVQLQEGAVGNVHLSIDSVTTDKIVSNSITSDKIVANSITTEKLHANSITADKIASNSITTNKLQANSITTDKLQANSITADKISANSVTADKIASNSITSDKISANSIATNALQAGSVTADKIASNSITSDKLQANSVTTDKLQANSITTEKLQANSITTDKLQANSITSDKIEANSIKSEHIQSNTITSNHIHAGTVTSEHIQAGSVESDHIKANAIESIHIVAEAITSSHIQTGAITAGSGIIADGAIGNAQISKLDAGKIDAGTIDTSKVTIQGADGHLRLKGNRMQVFQGTGNQAKERVSVGDVNGDGTVYGLRVRGADGQTILLDENGVKSEGITDGAITNSKISEDANIDGAKLNINSVISKINKDGTEVINGTKISVDGTNLEAKLSTITNKQSQDSEKISQAQSQITANTNAIKLKLDEQTYTSDKKDMTSKLEKNTSEISAMKGQIALKVDQSDITNAKSELEGVMDSKINSAKSEIKLTTDGISQKVSSVESTTSTLSGKVDTAQLTADSKAKVFTSTPTTPYSVGDLWVQGTSGDVMRCKTARSSGSYTASDWEKASKYTDDTKANAVDGKLNTLQSEYNTTKSKVTSIETDLSGITSRVSSVETSTSTLEGKVQSQETRLSTAEQKLTNDSITNVVQSSQLIKDINGKISTNTSNISKVEQTANSINSTVSDLSGKYTQIKQTVDSIDLSGKVSFSDLYTSGKTTINGANITTGTLDTNKVNIKGGTTKKIVIANDNYCVYDGTETDVNRKVFMGFRTSTATNVPSVMLGYNGINPYVDGAVVAGGTYTTFSHYPNNSNPEGINSSYGELAFKYGSSLNQFSSLNMYQSGDIDLKAGGSINFRPSLRGRDNASMVVGNSAVTVNVPIQATGAISTSGSLSGSSLTVNNTANLGSISTNKLDVYGNTGLNGTLYVKSTATVGSSLTAGSKIMTTSGSVSAYNDTAMLGYYGWFSTGNNNFYAVKVSNSYLVGTGTGFHVCSGTTSYGMLYAKNVSSTYSVEPTVALCNTRSVFDTINSVNVVDTEEGLRLVESPTRLASEDNTVSAISTKYNEDTEQQEVSIDYTSAISTLWKAVQELKSEVDALKSENKELKELIGKGV